MTTDFVSLHNQTEYSILDSLITVKGLFQRAKELEQKAVAIADHGTIASAYEALKTSRETGVKLIIGCEFYFQDDVSQTDDKFRHLVLLAKNAIGYKNLLTLNKKGYDQGYSVGKRVYSVIDWKLLEQHAEGLICLTACGNGIISQLLMNKKNEAAEKTLLKLKELFEDNLGIEVQPNNMRRGSNIFNDEIDQVFLNRQLINLGKKHNIKVVPACNAHYLTKEESVIHDVLLAIGAHQPIYSNYRLKYPVSDFYLKSGDEVKTFFTRNYGEEYASEICANSIYFADLCEMPDWIEPKFSNPSGKELPVFPVKEESDYHEFLAWLHLQTEEIKKPEEDKQYLKYKCQLSLEKFFKEKNISDELKLEYCARLEKELDVLYYCGVSSYMLIVADYVNWSRKNGVITGPGRGSCGGSIIAFLLNIHEADPIKYGLVFERFHNKLRQSLADVDIDFSKENRHKVIEYMTQKYGSDNVAQISNLIGITPKIYIKDVSRSCELGGSKDAAVKLGNDVADCVSADIKTIDDAIVKAPLFAEYCQKYSELSKYKSIANKYRSYGIHASGIVITQRHLTGLIPLRKDKNNVISIEYDKDIAEQIGLVKMDILGLSNLDLIAQTISLIKASSKSFNNEHLDYDTNDEKTYDLISKGDTFGVFQLGTSGGTIELCRKIKPKNIEDLAIITTLARPAARNIREDFIKTRNGKKNVVLIHPSLERAFRPTYGYPLYDESLLILAEDVAGWDLGEADKLRKLTKEKGKNPEKVKKWKKEFIEGAIKNGLHETIATKIWDDIVSNFGSYSFNKSHAVLYSMMSYQTAYLKAHFPIEFLLANLMAEVKSNAPDAENNIKKIKEELKSYHIKILPPDINKSQLTYTIIDGNKLVTGLDALKFVSDDAIKEILEKRPFKNFLDFMSRIDPRKVRANTIQALVACGCLDTFKIDRKLLFLYCSDYRKKLQVWMKKHDPIKEKFIYPWPTEPNWTLSEWYALENYYLGESFICKLSEAYGNFFKGEYNTIADIKKSKDRTFVKSVKAVIKSFFEFKVKKENSKYFGKSMIKMVIEDGFGDRCNCTIFPDAWEKFQKRLKEINKQIIFSEGLAIHFGGSVNDYEDNKNVILNQLFDIALIPTAPTDLKSKKINMKKIKNESPEFKNTSVAGMVDEIEDILINSGMINLDEVEE